MQFAKARNSHDLTEVAAWLLGLTFLMGLSSIVVLSRGTYGGADDVVHYKFSAWAFAYPGLFFDHWAKPLYTLAASLFAPFGFTGVRIMNVLMAVCSGYISYRFLRKQSNPLALWGLVFCVSAPLYFILATTGMTEIMGGWMLLTATVLFLRKHYGWSVALLSFLPFVRTEGVVLFPLFMLALLAAGKWKYFVLFPLGFLVYSLVGWKFHGDFLWVIHQMPYTGATAIYGHGSLLHFVKQAHMIFGVPLLIFWFVGLAGNMTGRFSTSGSKGDVMKLILVYLSPVVYFTAHSTVWWQGWGGSLGLPRVMTVIIPVMSIGAAEGIFSLIRITNRYTWPGIALQLATAGVLVWQLTAWYDHPTARDEETELVYRACQWMQKEEYSSRKIYYYNPFVYYYLGINPWDPDRSREKVPDPENPGRGIEEGEIVVWDSHFGPNEGGLPAGNLDRDSSLILIRVFEPDPPFTVLGNEPYQIRIYVKKNSNFHDRNGLIPSATEQQSTYDKS
ncbi:MAG TPA: hypothetical protein ENN63_12455 [Bacteroidetes bacterium]|nr:hypothetical protein [Bacteroidota bacterium]